MIFNIYKYKLFSINQMSFVVVQHLSNLETSYVSFYFHNLLMLGFETSQ